MIPCKSNVSNEKHSFRLKLLENSSKYHAARHSRLSFFENFLPQVLKEKPSAEIYVNF